MGKGKFKALKAQGVTVRECFLIFNPARILPVFLIITFFSLHSIPAFSSQYFAVHDTILENGIKSLMDAYFENFTLHNEHGNYEESRELRLRNLFDDDAMIFNFLPETIKPNRNISIDEYLATIRNGFQDKILRPGMYTWYILSTSPLAGVDNGYLVEVVMQKRVNFFDKSDMQLLNSDDWQLNARIRADLDNPGFKILDIRNLKSHTTDLNIRMLYPNRLPAGLKPIELEYYDPVLKRRVLRKRVADQAGMVTLTGVPVGSPIRINSPERRKVYLPVRLTAGQWNELPPNSRFVILGEKPRYIRNNKYNLFGLGAHHQFPMISPVFHTLDTLAQVFPAIDYTPAQDLYLHYSRMFFAWRRFGVSVGTGVEYQSINLSIPGKQAVYYISGTDDDPLITPPDTLIKNINTERYDYTGIIIPLSLNLSFFTHSRYFTGIRVGARYRYLIFNQHNYSFVTDSISSVPGPGIAIPEFEVAALSGSFKQNNRFSLALDLSFLFNIYRDLLHLQTGVSYNFQNTGNQGLLHNKTDEEPDYTSVYTPFLNRHELKFTNFSFGLGLALRF